MEGECGVWTWQQALVRRHGALDWVSCCRPGRSSSTQKQHRGCLACASACTCAQNLLTTPLASALMREDTWEQPPGRKPYGSPRMQRGEPIQSTVTQTRYPDCRKRLTSQRDFRGQGLTTLRASGSAGLVAHQRAQQVQGALPLEATPVAAVQPHRLLLAGKHLRERFRAILADPNAQRDFSTDWVEPCPDAHNSSTGPGQLLLAC